MATHLKKRLASRPFPTIPVSLPEYIIVEQNMNGHGSQEKKNDVQFAHPSLLDRTIFHHPEIYGF